MKNLIKLLRSPGLVILHLVMFALALSWLYPYAWMVLSSFKTTDTIYNSSLFGGNYSFENYIFLFRGAQQVQKPFLHALLNSLGITVVVTLAVLISSAIVAYALTKLEFLGRRQMNNFIVFQMVFPSFMFIIPQFILIKKMGLLDSYGALILPFVMSGWAIFMLSQSFKGTPNDYIEAAKIDGASDIWIIFRVMVPLNKAAMAIVGIFTATGIWDNFLWPLIVIKSDEMKMPLSVLLASFNKAYGIYVGSVLAGAVIQTLPMIVIFIVFRKYFLEGMNLSLK